MTDAAPSFKKLARTRRTLREDVSGAVEAFIEKKGIPTLAHTAEPVEAPVEASSPTEVASLTSDEALTATKPVAETAPRPAAVVAAPKTAPQQTRVAVASPPAPTSIVPGIRPPRGQMTYINIEVSRQTKRQLVDRAAHMECTLRFLIMEALHRAGYQVHDYELLPDGRAPRRRGEQGGESVQG